MKRIITTYLTLSVLTATAGCGAAIAADNNVVDIASQWDSAVSSLLLAAGMYGLEPNNKQDTLFTLDTSVNMFKTLPIEQDMLDSRNITLSYSGSSGRLDFSAGYIYTDMQANQDTGTLVVGLESPSLDTDSPPLTRDNAWYLALDYSKTFRVSDDFFMGIGSKTMLMKNPFNEQEGRILSMLLNLPMSYKNYFTLTPELQWSRSLPGSGDSRSFIHSKPDVPDNKDVFYGGMSISFSY